MTKKIKKLEKETMQWRTKWESNNQALLHMAEEKTLRDGHFKALQGKLELLERLCRALHKERNDLSNQLSLFQEQGDKGMASLGPDQQHEPLPMEEEDENDSEDSGHEEEQETGGIHQGVGLPGEEATQNAADKTTTAITTSSHAAGLKM
ncbi:hypothetical protein CHARACLAT_007639 [Characodon lateralis]|uniref:Taxilin gamma n=1 Tax=Characodon lateralis TaxID=208331 RepID=A0ABU7E1V3_9TELE|nr:hypothetical protein [Characodon lateralis]